MGIIRTLLAKRATCAYCERGDEHTVRDCAAIDFLADESIIVVARPTVGQAEMLRIYADATGLQ